MVTCPGCGTTETYYSALHQSWKCHKCGKLFALEEIVKTRVDRPTPKMKTEPVLKMKVGEADPNGYILCLREKLGNVVYDIWSSPKGRSHHVGIAYSDMTGKILSRHPNFENAKMAFDVIKEAHEKANPNVKDTSNEETNN